MSSSENDECPRNSTVLLQMQHFSKNFMSDVLQVIRKLALGRIDVVVEMFEKFVCSLHFRRMQDSHGVMSREDDG